MPGYTPQELERASKPLRTDEDRAIAYCTLGHLLTEQREAYSADREGTIKAITAAVQDFDTRTALGGASASSFAGTGGVQPVAMATLPVPALSAALPPAPPVTPGNTMAAGITVASASMDRELRRQGLLKAGHQPHGGSASMQTSTASMQRELRRAGLVPG